MRGKPIPYDAPPKLVPSDRRPDFDATFAQRRYAETNFPGAAMSEPVVGAPLLIHGASSAMSHGGADAAEGVVAVPSPSQGGKPGRANALAWSQGMAPTGTLTPRFGRRFMHVPYQRVHPVAGPVGFDKRT